MAEITFCAFDPARAGEVLPRMFDILSANMNKIAPTGEGYDADRRKWMSYMATEKDERRIILMYAGEDLAGYFQYSFDGKAVLVEEIEIKPEYQRTMVFYHFMKHIKSILPEDIEYVEGYINDSNTNSQRIARKLGMSPQGEKQNGHPQLYRGKKSKYFSK